MTPKPPRKSTGFEANLTSWPNHATSLYDASPVTYGHFGAALPKDTFSASALLPFASCRYTLGRHYVGSV